MKYAGSEYNEYTWGYHVNTNERGVIRGIKLSLSPGVHTFYNKLGSSIDPADNNEVQFEPSELARLYKSTVEIVSDYIRAAYTYALSQIRTESIGGYMDELKKEFAVTVPAIWSDQAKTRMLRVSYPFS